MRRPFLYLLLTRFKNQLKAMLKSPVKIIYTLLLIGLLVMAIFAGEHGGGSGILSYPDELAAVITAFYLLMFILTAGNGFKNGATMFSMSDINLLFTAPLSQVKVLFYGLFRQLTTSLLMGFFILFQYGWMSQRYGIGFGGLLLVLLGYGITMFLGQLTAMVIYSFTSADEKKRKLTKVIFYGIFALFIAYVLLQMLPSLGNLPGLMQAAIDAANSLVIHLMPVCGWMGWAISGCLFGTGGVLIGFGLTALLAVALVLMVVYGRSDFYEDVLKSTEISQSAIVARKEGQVQDEVPSNVKVGKIGLNGGWGASAFYYKHQLENRRMRKFFLSSSQLLFALCSIIFAVFMRSTGSIIPGFAFATYMQFFSVNMGRFPRELLKPYIYLVPDSPVKKMLHSLREALPTAIREAVLIMVPIGLIMECDVLLIVALIVARLTFTMVFLAANIAIERLWGGSPSKALIMFLYVLLIMIMSAPGIVLAAIVEGLTLGFFLMSAVNVLVALLVFYLCRNMLQYAEVNMQ